MIRNIIPRKPASEWKVGDIVRYQESGNPSDFTVRVEAVNGNRFDLEIITYVGYPDMIGRHYPRQLVECYRWVSSGLT